MIWLAASVSLTKPKYIEAVLSPVEIFRLGCCAPSGSWFRTEFTCALISDSALVAS